MKTARTCCLTAIAATAMFGMASQSVCTADVITTDPTGGGQSHANHQPGLGIYHVIALQGTFPSRNSADVTPQQMTEPYIGEIAMVGSNFAPRGWAFCDGQLLPIAQYTALFSILGTTYGGDGRTTFALPDLRGRSPLHEGAGPGLSNRMLGARGGTDNVTLTQTQMPAHVHQMEAPLDPTTSAGGGQAHTNMKPWLAINYNIAQQGTYPSRSSDVGDIVPNGVSPFLGQVQMFGGNFAPRGTASTDGQLLQISQNSALFSLLGTTYGGDGRTTFGLPDLRGRVTMHEGQGPGLTNRWLGSKLGTEQETLTLAKMPIHDHAAPDDVLNTGGGQAHNNMQPTNTLNYIIALQGVFPSRNSDVGEITSNQDPFISEIALFAGNFAPRGWAFCDGQLLPISQYSALFSLVGTTYGGDGRTTFGLPDLRGRVPVHPGQGPGLQTWTWGQRHGAEQVTLNVAQLPRHTHDYVPEPATAVLALIGLLWMTGRRVEG